MSLLVVSVVCCTLCAACGAELLAHDTITACKKETTGETKCPRPCVRGHESETVGPRPWARQCVRNVVVGSKSMYEAVDFVQLYAVSPMA